MGGPEETTQSMIVKLEQEQIKFEEYRKHLYLGVLQEECAELIQSISKINRFGLNSFNPATKETNRENLICELGDVLAMVELLKSIDQLNITNAELETAKQKKITKMLYWLQNPVNKAN